MLIGCIVLGLILVIPAMAGSDDPAQEGKAKTNKEEKAKTQEETQKIPEEDLREKNILTGIDLVDDDFLGSWPMFGENFRMKIGGRVKADFLYDFDGTLDRQQFLMSTIAVEGTPEHANRGYVAMFPYESRFNLDVRRIEKDKPPLQWFLEGDFWPSGNGLRLRHAYMVFGEFVAGQTWTTLSIMESIPYMIDFAAGDALFGGRTTQLRYQRRISERLKLAVAIESQDFMGIENPLDQEGKPSLGLPLLAVRADYQWRNGMLALGTSLAQLRWDGGAEGPYARALQWAAVVAGRQYLGKDNYATWNVSYGKGSGENIMAFAGSAANAVLTEDGRLETMPAFAFVLGFVHKWSDKLTSNLSYAYGWLIDTPESRDPLALKKGGIGHVNLIWQPTKHFSAGVEYMHGAQQTTDHSQGRANRLQGMVKVDF